MNICWKYFKCFWLSTLQYIQQKDMQRASEELRTQLWDKLKVVYNKYAGNGGEIAITRVEEIVRDVLGEETQQQIDYVIKNMFRLDADGSGTVDFLQFGNFLFKRHCGEMSLQNLHRNNKISRGSDRLINPRQLFTLLNNAYSFLKVSVAQDVSENIHRDTDKDRDGYITYVEYFQFIDKFICQTRQQFSDWSKTPTKKKDPEPVVDTDRLWNGRLRLFLWGQLQKLYEAFVKTRVLSVNDQNLRGLIVAILGQLSQLQITFLLNGLFKLEQKNIEFIPFAIIFFYLIAELGLSRYQRNHNSDKKMINVEQFILIIRNTFKFLSIERVRSQLLRLIFAKIDTNRDGLISLAEYLQWVKRYLAVNQNKGEQFYLREDDSSLQGEDFFNNSIISEVKTDKIEKKSSMRIVFNFSSYDLSDQVRKRVYELLVPFDKNFDKKFDEHEIHDALITLLKQDEHQLYYMTKNVFRYDVDNDKCVTYDELTNFCVEWHFGEMAIQRLHRKNNYSRGKERIMNENEFGFTLNHALGFIGLTASAQQIRTLFSEINLEKNGWISYQIYFLFLKHYFGSLKTKGQAITPVVDPDAEWLKSLSGLSALERFIRLLVDQLRRIFMKYDYNKNLLFEQDEIEAILQHVFGLNETEVSYIILRFFNFAKRQNKSLQFDELVKILLEVYFIEIIMKRKYKDVNAEQWKNRRISLIEFIELVLFACFFLRAKPSKEDLTVIFRIIDTDNDGYISFAQYAEFIRKYLGLNIKVEDEVKPLPNPDNTGKPGYISNEEWQFINAIWGELRTYFNRYDAGSKGYLTEDDLKRFVIEVLNENTTRELEYIFWNLFRVDPNGDRSVEFHEFAPFILSHTGEIALQRFHREQTKGKSTLTENELFIVFSNAFSFLSTMPKSRNVVNIIYKRIGNNSAPSYGAYLGWINRALASKFRQ